MREIHPSDVHSVLDELEENLGGPADRTDGADNAGQPHLVSRGVHVEVGDVLDVGVALPSPLLTSGDIALLQDGLNKIIVNYISSDCYHQIIASQLFN